MAKTMKVKVKIEMQIVHSLQGSDESVEELEDWHSFLYLLFVFSRSAKTVAEKCALKQNTHTTNTITKTHFLICISLILQLKNSRKFLGSFLAGGATGGLLFNLGTCQATLYLFLCIYEINDHKCQVASISVVEVQSV